MSRQKCFFLWVSEPTSNTRFLGSTCVSLSNGISIGSAVFAQLTRVTNTHTDMQTTLRATSVAIGRIYALSTGDAA